MSASANVQTGSMRNKVADHAAPSPRNATVAIPGPKDRTKAAPAAEAASRCSPDPCQHTDRYRLVTPFSLRL